MAYYRFRGSGHFTAGVTRSGNSFTYGGRRVLVRGDNFQLNWNGPAIDALILDAVADALTKLGTEALAYMQSIVPVDTGATRDSCFANITVEGDHIILAIGAGTPYTVYIELGTSTHSAQPFIRPTFDAIKSRLPEIIRAEVQKRANAVA